MVAARVAGVPRPRAFSAWRNAGSLTNLPAVSIAPSKVSSVYRAGGEVFKFPTGAEADLQEQSGFAGQDLEQAGALARRRRVALLLIDVPRGLVVVRLVAADAGGRPVGELRLPRRGRRVARLARRGDVRAAQADFDVELYGLCDLLLPVVDADDGVELGVLGRRRPRQH